MGAFLVRQRGMDSNPRGLHKPSACAGPSPRGEAYEPCRRQGGESPWGHHDDEGSQRWGPFSFGNVAWIRTREGCHVSIITTMRMSPWAPKEGNRCIRDNDFPSRAVVL